MPRRQHLPREAPIRNGIVDLDEGLRVAARILGEPALDAAMECVVLRYADGPLFAFRVDEFDAIGPNVGFQCARLFREPRSVQRQECKRGTRDLRLHLDQIPDRACAFLSTPRRQWAA